MPPRKAPPKKAPKPVHKAAPKPVRKPAQRLSVGEPCAGCDVEADRFPMVGVTMDRETGEWEAFPVCEMCWRDPAHRVHPLKMHFFPASQAKQAVAMAGSSGIG